MNSSGKGKSAFVGNKNKNSVIVENCYYNANRFASEDEQEAGYTYTQMRDQNNYTGFDFQKIWEIDSTKNNGYPQLKGMEEKEDIWNRFAPHLKVTTDDSEKYTFDRSRGTPYIVEKYEKIYLKFDCDIKIHNAKGVRILNFATKEEKEMDVKVVDGCKLSITPKKGWDEKVARYDILIDNDALCENYGEENGFLGLTSSDRCELATLSRFYEGKGTEASPYLIYTPYQLSCIRYRFADHFQLEDDLDLSSYNSGEWSGIGGTNGSSADPVEFSGVFDGKNNIIKGISVMKEVIYSSSSSSSGLFAHVNGGVIKNVGINSEDVILESMNYSNQSRGLLVGKGTGKLENCFVKINTAEMKQNGSGTRMDLGLLAGNFSGEVKRCFSEGELKFFYGSGTVIGGLVGAGAVTISDSYCNANIIAAPNRKAECAGGIFGGRYDGYKTTVVNCYYHGTIEQGASKLNGGIIANGSSLKAESSYYDTSTIGIEENNYGIGKTIEEMKVKETYKEWDFDSIWGMDGKTNDGFPYLKWFSYEYERVDRPVASMEGGTYYEPLTVELSTKIQDAEIYYTTDGTKPDKEKGIRYTKEISIDHFTKLRAIAVKKGMRDSKIMEEVYLFQIKPLEEFKLFDGLNVGVDDDKVLKFFPGNLSLKATVIPVSFEHRTDDDGSYNVKIAIGIGKCGWFDKDKEWNRYKKMIELIQNSEDSMKKYARMESVLHAFGGKSISCVDIKGFKATPKISIMGYYEMKIDKNGYMVKNKGMVAGDLKWSGSINKNFYTSIGPMYLTLGADGSLKGKIGVQNKFKDNDYLNSQFGLTGQAQAKMSASVEGGYGIAKVATIGAKGEGGFSLQFVPWGKVDFSASASVHLYVAFVLDTTYDLATYEETLWEPKKPGGGTRSVKKNLPVRDASMNLRPVDRSYAEYTSTWKGSKVGKRKIASSAKDAELSNVEMILQSGVMPNTLPMIQQIGEDSVIVFQANDMERTTLDSSVLMYSVYHNGIWSEPSPVWDTGTCDMYADLQVIGDELYVVWQKENGRISENTGNIEDILQKMAEKSEICFAKYNQQTRAFEGAHYITSNQEVDMMPKLVYGNENVSVAWVRNSENCLMQETGTNNIIFSELKNGAFSKETVLSEVSGTVEEYEPFYMNEKFNVGYVSKISSDSEMNQVYVVNQDGQSSSISDGTALTTNIQYMDGTLYYWEDGIIQTYNLDSGSKGNITAGESAIASNGKIYKNNGKTAIIWSTPNQKNGTSSVYSSVMMEDGFSEPVVLHTVDASISHLDGLLKADNSWQLIMNTAETDGTDDIHSIVFATPKSKPEIQVESIIVDGAANEGEDTPVSYIVTNTSEETIHELELVIEERTRASTKKTISVTIAPGETIYGTYYLDLSGFSDISETSISLNAVGQSEPQNTVTQVLAQTDLKIVTTMTETDEDICIAATVSNNSVIPANAILSVYKDVEQKELIESVQLGEISKEENGTYTFCLKKALLEKNENNAYYLPVVVTSDKTDNDEENNVVINIAYGLDKEDQGDKEDTENKGDQEDTENKGDQGDEENTENKGDKEDAENKENQGDKENTENKGDKEDAENKGDKGKGDVANTENKGDEKITHKTHNYKKNITKATTSKNGSVVTKCSVCGKIGSTTPIYYPADIRLAKTNYTYNGKTQKPSVAVKGSNGKPIKASNYKVLYSSGCKKIGHYKVTIKFKGNYSGTVVKKFNINPKGTKLSNIKAAKKKAVVKWKKQAKNTKGYQIQYSTKKNFKSGAKTKTVKGSKKTSLTLKGLKSKKTYYIRVRTYQNVTGGKCYSVWSKSKKVKVK